MSRGPSELMNHIVMVDNTEGILEQSDNLVVVPSFEASYMYDVLGNIDQTDTRKIARAKELLTDPSSSFLGAKVAAGLAKALEQQHHKSVTSFRALYYQALGHVLLRTQQQPSETNDSMETTTIVDTTKTNHSRPHYLNTEFVWRTLRNRLGTYMRVNGTNATGSHNAFNLVAFLTAK